MKSMTEALLSEDHTYEKSNWKKHPEEEIDCNRLIHNIKSQPTAPVPGPDSSFFAHWFCCHQFSSSSLSPSDTEAEPKQPCTRSPSDTATRVQLFTNGRATSRLPSGVSHQQICLLLQDFIFPHSFVVMLMTTASEVQYVYQKDAYSINIALGNLH